MAQEFRRLIPEFARHGMTVLVTTHYMLEADEICDRIAVINHGRAIAEGTPAEIKRGLGDAVVTEATVRRDLPGLLEGIQALPGVAFAELVPDGVFFKLRVYSLEPMSLLPQMQRLAGEGNLDAPIERSRTLEEAYIALVR